MRKMASIQRILDINPIENADAIEVATVLGWHVVVKRNEFQINDLVVYIEIDSFVPNIIAPFLTKEGHFPKIYEGIEGERLRTVKLRGQISQGMVLPLSVLPQIARSSYPDIPDDYYYEDQDVSEILGIVKYDPPLPAQLAGTARGNFPSFIPKTDETRVQTLQRLLEEVEGTPSFITEKLDGSSMTVYHNDGVFGVCSRNLDLKETEGNSFWTMARQLDLETKLRSIGNYAIQGELIGPGIQSNRLKRDRLEFYAFNVYDISTGTFLSYREFFELCAELEIPTVPVLEPLMSLFTEIDDYITLATRKSVINPSVWAEGIVIRPRQEITHPRFGRVSFKAINPEFLLKFGE